MNQISAYKRKWFEFLDYSPHPGQQKVHNALDKKRFVVSCCGRRWGKSMAAAKEAEALVSQPNKNIWIVAPTYSTSAQ